MKELSKNNNIKGKNLFHPVRYALTGEMSGQDVTKQLSLLKMAEVYDLLSSTAVKSMVTLEHRMKRLEIFLESIPQQYHQPALTTPAQNAKTQQANANVEKIDTTASKTTSTSSSDGITQLPSETYEGPPFTALDIRVGLIKNAYEHPDADKLYVEEIDLG